MQKKKVSGFGTRDQKTSKPPAYPQVETMHDVSNGGIYCRFCNKQIDQWLSGMITTQDKKTLNNGGYVKLTHPCGNVIKVI